MTLRACFPLLASLAVALCLLAAAGSGIAHATSNPFLSRSAPPSGGAPGDTARAGHLGDASRRAEAGPGAIGPPPAPAPEGEGHISPAPSSDAAPWSPLLASIARVQRSIRAELSARLRVLRDKPNTWGLLTFLALAFGYGAVHAAGPGHGKAVAASFVIARSEPPVRAALLGMTMGAAHAASAALLVLVLHMALEGSLMAGFQSGGLWVERASYALVCAIALWMAYEAVIEGYGSHAAPPAQRKGFWATGVATGMVPCPGAAIVLLFSLALDAVGIGLAAVAAMALGMGLTIAATGVLASCCGRGALALSASRPGLSTALRRGFGLCGGVVIFLFGAALLCGTY